VYLAIADFGGRSGTLRSAARKMGVKRLMGTREEPQDEPACTQYRII
jgi:hypothetical protein